MTRRSRRRGGRGTVQGPVKRQQLDGMSRTEGGGGRGVPFPLPIATQALPFKTKGGGGGGFASNGGPTMTERRDSAWRNRAPGPHAHRNTARQATDDGRRTEVCGQQKQSNDPGNNQHILNTPIIGHR